MATPKIVADFETRLATALAVGGTSFTLASATDDDGAALPTGLYYFTVDNGTSQKEYLAGTLTGTSVASVVSVSRQGVETSGAARAHRVGASVILTDFLAYKKYMDEISLVSAPDASTTTKGVVEIATLAEVRAGTGTGATGATLAVSPTELDDMPTQDEKAALAGAGAAPSGSNKFLTVGDVDDNTLLPPPQVVPFTSSGTWTKDAGLKYVIVEVQASGGSSPTTTSTDGETGGGGGGGYGKKLIPAASLGATETVTIGTVGNSSSFGAHVSATSGASSVANDETGALGGTATGGDINIPGQHGGYSNSSFGAGAGGDSFLGRGGSAVGPGATACAGFNYGGGASGTTASGSADATGNSGAPAIVIVTEYYS